jgi:hypothetical protein
MVVLDLVPYVRENGGRKGQTDGDDYYQKKAGIYRHSHFFISIGRAARIFSFYRVWTSGVLEPSFCLSPK